LSGVFLFRRSALDRTIGYVGAIPRIDELLLPQKFSLYALGYYCQAVLGTDAVVDGLVCAPTAPNSLHVTVGSGSIYELAEVDASPYSDLGTDTNTIVKQGLLIDPVNLTITPPTTSGYSQVYLIQANYQDVDDGAMVLPYYDADHPEAPYAGPGNDGTSQSTLRRGRCAIGLKAGAAAPTGTQVTPAPDLGFTSLYTISVSNGQSTIASQHIVTHPDAPFITLKLPRVPAAIQAQAANFAQDIGTANALSVVLPSYTNVVGGLTLRIKKGNAGNTGTASLSINAAASKSIIWADGSALAAGDWPAGAVGEVCFSGTVWHLLSIAGPTVFARVAPGSSPVVNDAALVHYGVDTGSANSIAVGSVTPAITGGMTTGMLFEIAKGSNANTSAVSATICGQVGSVVWADGSPLVAGDWPGGAPALLAFDGLYFRLLSVMGPTVFSRVLPQNALVHYGVASGTNTLTTTVSPAITQLLDGTLIELRPTAVNTGPVTLNPNNLGAASVTNLAGGALTAGTFQIDQPVLLMALNGALKLLNSGGGAGLTNVQVFLASGNYVPSAGAQKALVIVTDGGGAGGAHICCAGGGGAGATVFALINLSGISSLAVTIGAGDVGVAAPSRGTSTGGEGGTSVFGSYAIAPGGKGCQGNDKGGDGGVPTVGLLLIKGGDGDSSYTGGDYGCGSGGASFWGGGGAGADYASQHSGYPAKAPGSGGGGADSSFSNRSGGDGAAGVALVLEF
jgi:hypothetical protein